MTLSRALPACSVSRSASSMMTTEKFPLTGRELPRSMIPRTSASWRDSRSVRAKCTSAWVPASAVVQPRHSPQPTVSGSVHCSAAAKARAATVRPEPGGPVNSHAWVIAPTADSASRRISRAVRSPSTHFLDTHAARESAERTSGCPASELNTGPTAISSAATDSMGHMVAADSDAMGRPHASDVIGESRQGHTSDRNRPSGVGPGKYPE